MRATVILSMMLAALGATVARAEVPRTIDHQGYLTTDAGSPVTGTRSMVFTIYDAVAAGAALWTETQSVTVTDGLFNVFLGDVTALPDSIFTGQPLYLGVRIRTDSEMTPRIRLTTVPCAFASGHDSWPARHWFQDADQDSFGNPYVWVPSVGRPAGYVADSTDCDDGNAAVHPGAAETCDGEVDEVSCDDGIPCTYDLCYMGCIHDLAPGSCLIGGACYGQGDANPANECQVCDPEKSQYAWSPRENGTACTGGTCQAGTCTPP